MPPKFLSRITYHHLARCDRASSHTVAAGAWFLQVPGENDKLLSLWLKNTLSAVIAYQFDGDFLICADVCAYRSQKQGHKMLKTIVEWLLTMVDISEGATAQFTGQSVFSTDSKFHFFLLKCL